MEESDSINPTYYGNIVIIIYIYIFIYIHIYMLSAGDQSRRKRSVYKTKEIQLRKDASC